MQRSWKDNLFIVLAFVMMGILFYSSSMPYGDQSMTSTLDSWLAGEPLKGLLSHIEFTYAGSPVSIAAKGYVGFVEFFLRKGAHFGSYFLIGLFWFLGLRNKTSSLPLAALLSFMLAAGYASFDEFHQGLTPDRTPLLEDILLDCFGAVTGVGVGWILTVYGVTGKRKKKWKKSAVKSASR